MKKDFWIVIAVLLIIWSISFFVIVYYAEEMRNHPCSICSKTIGKSVTCIEDGGDYNTRTFYPNGSIEDGTAGNLQIGEQ